MTIESISTLIEMLAYRADVSASKAAFTFNGVPCSFGELLRGVDQFAARLLSFNIQRQEPVVLALPNSVEFFFAFYGIQRAGGIAVPIFPSSGMERIFSIAELCGARIIVVPSNLPAESLRSITEAGKNRGATVIGVQEKAGEVNPVTYPKITPEDVAFIQYTSGSTGNPKGVMLTHANLLTNIRQLITGMEITEREVFVSWLPVYHDMGLILKTMVPFYLAAETHLLPTELRDVRPWLKAIETHKATFTAAPDFAYRLVLSRIQPNEFDLSSLRVALNAAEPVRVKTIHAFEERFGLHNVMTAGYGLAEATVGVSMSKPGQPLKADERGIVSVGKPFPDISVKIVDGEIWIKSAANCKGYYNNPDETKHLFHNGFVVSGDTGYLGEEGHLYITGRKKNIIKHLGQTIAAQELEEIVDSISNVRFSAALGIDRERIEGEQVYLFAEVRHTSTTDLQEMTLQTVETIHERFGFRPARVFFLKPHGIPRTYNGKTQHALLREQYLSGTLKEKGMILYPDD